ncbi:MAG: sodium:calcium antiporter [Phycisphaerae bacterium]
MFPTMPLWLDITVFLVAGVVITIVGTRLAGLADLLADRTGLGEAFTGAVFLGATKSLPGILTSVITAHRGYPELAMSNAIGGMAAQTTFLALADFFYRKINLEHAAASVPNILSGAMLVVLLGLILVAVGLPATWTLFGVHAATPVLFIAYALSLKAARKAHQFPAWKPTQSKETVEDEPDADSERDERSMAFRIGEFLVLAGLTVVAGYAVAQTGVELVQQTGLKQTIVGGLFTAVATSTPELVTAIAAVRRGALTLAVGDIVGGNTFDCLFAAAADVAYRDGSIYHAMGAENQFLIALTIVMTGVLVMGLLYREKRGMFNIGFESVIVLLLYAGGFVILWFY